VTMVGMAEEAIPTARWRWVRLVVLAALVVGLLVTGRLTGLTDRLSTPALRATIAAAGAWGPVLFVLAFCAGELVQVPGVAFVAAAVFAYGPVSGAVLSLVGAIASVSFTFAFVRTVGGKPLASLRWPFAQRLLARLDRHPVLTIALLRLVLWISPPLSYALALSGVRFRSYLAGSALGLAIPVPAVAFACGWLLG
jgi:uncharacterized membrane protein YdjX (TVP38/TMEM64 family)